MNLKFALMAVIVLPTLIGASAAVDGNPAAAWTILRHQRYEMV